MNDFRHVVMTRFNLATPGREASFRNKPDWLASRFDLFERYCLPGMAAQTCQIFEWIVYFDIDTPAVIRERIERDREIRPFHAFYTPLFDANGWRDSVFRFCGANAPPWLLTTNLDNDDSLAIDYVERLQAAARLTEQPVPRAINLANGFTLNGPRLYAHRHLSNAFTNLLERFDQNARTAPSIPHMELAKHVPVQQVFGDGAWLQVVHGGNVSNKIRGRRGSKNLADSLFARSAVSDVRSPTVGELAFDRLAAAPLREVRDKAIGLARTILKRA
jgi:hypothetical protein